MDGLLTHYDAGSFLDEAIAPDGTPREHYRAVLASLEALGPAEIARRMEAREVLQRSRGVTFSVYAEGAETERTFPLDLVPRIITGPEWSSLEQGLIQRVRALDHFLNDIYGDRAIVRDGVVPAELVLSSPQFQRQAWGIKPAHAIHINVAGLDVVRGDNGRWQVLEDNLRVPSGASYVIENREIMARVLPELFGAVAVRPVDQYPALLRESLRTSAPETAGDDAQIVLLTPGAFNSAYFEHTLLARHMGIPLVEGSDLITEDSVVYMRTTRGRRRVDVVYRRVDDEFLDPVALRADSLLGCAGLLGAARAGNVTIANAVGNGIADDKAMFAYVPDMIRYYLNETPAIDSVPTFLCADPDQCEEVLRRMDELVVKPVDASGGYGLLIGPAADEQTLDRFRAAVRANPRRYIAQEVVRLTRHPTLAGELLAPRHVDLRPFIVQGGNGIHVLPGGLTRVALTEGSLVVNSSQGGGSKDTWVLIESPPRDGRRGTTPSPRARRSVSHPMPGGGSETSGQQPQQQQEGTPSC